MSGARIDPRIKRRVLAGTSGMLAGVLVGAVVVSLAGTTAAVSAADDPAPPRIEATHLPLLLRARGEPVVLRYDAYCVADESPDQTCHVTGTVFVRAEGAGDFEAIPLRRDPDAQEGRYVARVPGDVAASGDGFAYYAVLWDETHGVETTLPGGGATAPQRSLPLGEAIPIHLGSHVFGRTRAAVQRVASAAWGDGPNDVGLEQGRNLTPIGGSAFDVDATGAVSVLDEVHRRLLRWAPGAHLPASLVLPVDGTLADMSIDGDGTIYVLESAGHAGEGRLLRVFGSGGVERASGSIAERAEEVRVGPQGAVVLQQPSGQWTSATSNGTVLSASAQRMSGRAGRPLQGGGEVVLLRVGNEIRVALAGPNEVRRSWRITSETSLAEVQLAEPLGSMLVLVVRAYTDGRDEFVVLVLGPHGIVDSFSINPADWAETAPVSRFRVARSSLYQLGSTPAGLFVDRFALEVR